MTGAGEHVEPLPGDKPPLIVVPLDAELSTAAVYRAFDELGAARTADELAAAAEQIRDGELEYVNDLERAARRLCPAIDDALQALRDVGVAQPMVTGSGPTVFGVSDDPEALARIRTAYPRAVAA
jgi:4-diphosphocytidyl-2-C-methyl-D-erythritol kinase